MSKKKKVPLIFPILLWLIAVVLGMEVAAKIVFIKGKGAAAHYSAHWKLREVSEGFSNDLWDIPWVDYKPGSRVSYQGEDRTYTASINSVGFRGPNFPTQSNPSLVKIACFGGSTTVNGPSDAETYPALLEAFLNNQQPSPQVSILNCGVASMDSSNYYKSLKKLIEKDAKPDMIIEYNGINSVCWQLIPLWKLNNSSIEKLLLKSQFIKYFFGEYFIPSEAEIRTAIRSNSISNLSKLQEQLNHYGIKLCVTSFVCPEPSLCDRNELSYLDYNLRYWWQSEFINYRSFHRIMQIYNEELKRAFESTDAVYLPLAEYGDFGPESFFDVCHMKPEGIQKKAFILARLLDPILNQ